MLIGRKRKKKKVEEPAAVPAAGSVADANADVEAKRAKTEEVSNEEPK